MADVITKTGRLIIRPWRKSDRAKYLATCNTDAVTAHLGGPASLADIVASLGRIRESQDENGFCFWAVERKTDQAFIGYCGLKVIADDVTPVKGEVEIGWRLREDIWGQGYVTEAARACLKWAWANLTIPRVVAFTTPANERSWRVMERIGMDRRPDLDFSHPAFAADHPLSRHVTYSIERPAA
jgi:RimJ/RimL family protein N-acetyltransferase